MYRIVIGDKAHSSWSMRGWLCLAAFGLAFEEELVRMYDPAFAAALTPRAPARTVPILEWTDAGQARRVWDTAAIAETLAERHPEAGLWPEDGAARADARALAAEMHSGFAVLRGAAPMNLHRAGRPLAQAPEGLAADLARLGALWAWALDRHGGPWLAGPRFSLADVFYAPVATRLTSYALATPATLPYAERLLAHPAVARWCAEGRADPRRIAVYQDIA